MHHHLILVALIATPLFAQQVHIVGPGSYSRIDDAVAVASPGDVIHVLPGTYPHFTVDRAVTIRAVVPDTVGVAFDAAIEDPSCLAVPNCAISLGTTLFAPPPEARVHVVGIDFVPNFYSLQFPFAVRHRVRVSSGNVTFDQCRLRATDSHALVVANARVHLQDCTLTALGGMVTGHGLQAINSTITAVDCAFTGNSTTGLSESGSGVLFSGPSLHVSHCTLTGGTHPPVAGGGPGTALLLGPSGSVWISDSELLNDGTLCAILGSAPILRTARTTITPGGSGCTTVTAEPLLGVTRPVPLENGTTFTVDLRTEPNTLVAVHASPGLGQVSVPGLFAQPIALDLTTFWLAGLYVSDGNGQVVATWDLDSGSHVDETVWLQAMALMTDGTFQLAPVVGGVIR